MNLKGQNSHKLLKMKLPFNPATRFLGIYPKDAKTLIQKDTCIPDLLNEHSVMGIWAVGFCSMLVFLVLTGVHLGRAVLGLCCALSLIFQVPGSITHIFLSSAPTPGLLTTWYAKIRSGHSQQEWGGGGTQKLSNSEVPFLQTSSFFTTSQYFYVPGTFFFHHGTSSLAGQHFCNLQPTGGRREKEMRESMAFALLSGRHSYPKWSGEFLLQCFAYCLLA